MADGILPSVDLLSLNTFRSVIIRMAARTGAIRIIVMRDRCSEDTHHRITDELVEHFLVGNAVDHDGEVVVEQLDGPRYNSVIVVKLLTPENKTVPTLCLPPMMSEYFRPQSSIGPPIPDPCNATWWTSSVFRN